MTQPDPQGARARMIAFEGPDNPVDLARINALIDAIEAEAAAAVLSRVREQVEGLRLDPSTVYGDPELESADASLRDVLSILAAEERTVTTDPSGDTE